MRLARAVLTVAATALTPALLLTTPAFATGATGSAIAGVTASTDGSATPADETEDQVAVFRILHIAQQNNDRAVIREATAALDAGTPEALRVFLETGYRLAQFEDDQVAVFRILADPTISDALRTAAEQTLDNATPESLRYFLEHGQYEVDA